MFWFAVTVWLVCCFNVLVTLGQLFKDNFETENERGISMTSGLVSFVFAVWGAIVLF